MVLGLQGALRIVVFREPVRVRGSPAENGCEHQKVGITLDLLLGFSVVMTHEWQELHTPVGDRAGKAPGRGKGNTESEQAEPRNQIARFRELGRVS